MNKPYLLFLILTPFLFNSCGESKREYEDEDSYEAELKKEEEERKQRFSQFADSSKTKFTSILSVLDAGTEFITVDEDTATINNPIEDSIIYQYEYCLGELEDFYAKRNAILVKYEIVTDSNKFESFSSDYSGQQIKLMREMVDSDFAFDPDVHEYRLDQLRMLRDSKYLIIDKDVLRIEPTIESKDKKNIDDNGDILTGEYTPGMLAGEVYIYHIESKELIARLPYMAINSDVVEYDMNESNGFMKGLLQDLRIKQLVATGRAITDAYPVCD